MSTCVVRARDTRGLVKLPLGGTSAVDSYRILYNGKIWGALIHSGLSWGPLVGWFVFVWFVRVRPGGSLGLVWFVRVLPGVVIILNMAKFLHWCMITDYIMPIIGEILMIYDSPNHQIKVFAKFSYIMYIYYAIEGCVCF